MLPVSWLDDAARRIAPHIVETPLTYDAARRMFIKWENRQITGSFKPRGALNKVLTLEQWERDGGLVAASAGNHGQGVALAAQLTKCSAEVFVPAHAPATKVASMERLGARVHLVDGGYSEAEATAKAFAQEHGKVYVSPYNDGQVIAGQGTVAIEILGQRASISWAQNDRKPIGGPKPETWVVPVGGGGLISGCALVLRERQPGTRLVGVQAAASPFTYSLFHHNTQDGVADNPTLADGLSGGIDGDSITIPMLKELVADIVLVSEETIRAAIAFAWKMHHERIEGSGAAALGAVLDGGVTGVDPVVIVTGGNIDDDVFDDIVSSDNGH